MPDLHYEHPRLAAIYDADNGWSIDRDFYLALAGAPPQRILELGCGTGLLARAYAARGHQVTGVDPAPSMIEAGRHQPHGDSVQWVHAPAELYRSDQRFDLIIMTGHAFQALVSDAEIDGTLGAIATHIASGGRTVFESRNPEIDWAARWDGDTWIVQTPAGPVNQSNKVIGWNGDRLTFEQNYDFGDERLSSTSTLRFLAADEIVERLVRAGLRIASVVGDWSGTAFDPAHSEEMIFSAQRA